MEKLKFELSDVIDSKFEFITKNLDNETRQLRATYEELSNCLRDQNKDLLSTFKEKITTIRTMSATFFAKTESECAANIKRVSEIAQQFEKFSASYINPAKELDSHIYSMHVKI